MIYDVGIIGAGVAGAFATYRLATTTKNKKIIAFDLGRPPLKRRRQLEGWLGCFPNSDAKLYLSDINKIHSHVDKRRSNKYYKMTMDVLKDFNPLKIVKDNGPTKTFTTTLKENNFDIVLNDYIQFYPKEIHYLSKFLSESISKNKNVHMSFDNEIFKLDKKDNMFHINSENGDFICKKIIIATGRSGWRWQKDIFNQFGLIKENNISKIGIKIEMDSSGTSYLNNSSCTLSCDKYQIGPFQWKGSIIQEDHLDMSISAFRSNESRWKTDKLIFDIIGNIQFENNGFEQAERLSKLAFLLSNDRVSREKTSLILSNKGKLSPIKEFDWLKDVITDTSKYIPEIINKSYYHIPTLITETPKINLTKDFETDINGMFVVGEAARFPGILSAMVSGLYIADHI